MKATLTFKLPEEQDEYNDAVKGMKFRMALSELNDNLYAAIKYGSALPGGRAPDDQIRRSYIEVRDLLFKVLEDLDLSLE